MCFGCFGHKACGISASQGGIKPAPDALEGEVWTTGPPGKSLYIFKKQKSLTSFRYLKYQIFWYLKESQSVAQSCPILCNPMDCSYKAPLSIGFPRQEYWSGWPFVCSGNLANSGIEVSLLSLLCCRQILYCLSHRGPFGVWPWLTPPVLLCLFAVPIPKGQCSVSRRKELPLQNL